MWDVVHEEGEFQLRSRVRGTLWVPHQETQARCYLSGRGRTPHERCSCGIHAARSAGQVVPYLTRWFTRSGAVVHRIVGRVTLWGLVVEGMRGARASRAYPRDLYIPAPRSRLSSLQAGVPSPRVPPNDIACGLAAYGVSIEILPYAKLDDLRRALRRVEMRHLIAGAVRPGAPGA